MMLDVMRDTLWAIAHSPNPVDIAIAAGVGASQLDELAEKIGGKQEEGA